MSEDKETANNTNLQIESKEEEKDSFEFYPGKPGSAKNKSRKSSSENSLRSSSIFENR